MVRFPLPPRRVIAHRIAEGLREVGVLFWALAPLDLAFTEIPAGSSLVPLFLVAGILLFMLGLVAEAFGDKS
jgi:hypothetical protein